MGTAGRFRRDGDRLTVLAPAKLNLDLLVGPSRHDGFHDIDSVVCRIDLCDEITISPPGAEGLAFASSGIPAGPDAENLAYYAARRLLEYARKEGRAIPSLGISLHKRIPPGSGLGGGSSDAAAALEGVALFCGLNVERKRLLATAAGLGSDVSLFLGPVCSRITGRGETVVPVEIHPVSFVVHFSGVHCPTAAVYAACETGRPPGARPLPVDVFARPPSQWRHLLVNDLEPPARRVRGGLAERLDTLRAATDLPVCLTGSGGALFIACDDEEEAAAAVGALPDDLRADTIVAGISPW